MKNIVWCLVFAALSVGMPSSVWAQTTVFPPRGVEIVNALYAGTNAQNDDARRLAIRRTCEQMAHDLGAQWGGKKRAGLGDEFRSPDSIAVLEANNTISIWDIQLSSGAIDVFPGKPPSYPNDSLSNSAFMPCQPVDHMNGGGGSGPAPQPQPGQPPIVVLPPSPAPSIDLSRVYEKLDAIDATTKETREDVKAVRSGMNKAWKVIGKYGPIVAGMFASGWFMKPNDDANTEAAK